MWFFLCPVGWILIVICTDWAILFSLRWCSSSEHFMQVLTTTPKNGKAMLPLEGIICIWNKNPYYHKKLEHKFDAHSQAIPNQKSDFWTHSIMIKGIFGFLDSDKNALYFPDLMSISYSSHSCISFLKILISENVWCLAVNLQVGLGRWEIQCIFAVECKGMVYHHLSPLTMQTRIKMDFTVTISLEIHIHFLEDTRIV